jgi:predicted kinase
MNKSKPTLYLIRGVSGSGKSTFSKQLQDAGIVGTICEADQYFYEDGQYNFKPSLLGEAHKYCRLKAKASLNIGKSVAVSNTSTTEEEVEVYKDLADWCGANFVSIIMENRSGTESIHDVPPEALEKQRKRFSVKL